MDAEIIEWIRERNQKGEEWVMIAGIPMQAVRHNLPGNRVGVGLRTLEGVGYWITDAMPNQIDYRKLTFMHDVTIKKKLYVVYLIPEDLARRVQGVPLKGPTGYPAILGTTANRIHVLRRDERFDGPQASPVIKKTTITLPIPDDLLDAVKAQAERHDRTLEEEFLFELSTGLRRQLTVQKHRESRKLEQSDQIIGGVSRRRTG